MSNWDTRIETCHHIVVCQITGGGKKKFHFATSQPAAPLVHLRSDPPYDIAEREQASAAILEGQLLEVPAAIYAGPIWLHFGHFIAECLHRLHAVNQPGLTELPIFYHTSKLYPLPSWASDILSILQIDLGRINYIDRPTRFGILHVPVQGRLINGKAVHPHYADVFPSAAVLAALPSVNGPRRLYVSRSRHRFSGSYLGESYVEEALTAAGFHVVHPETLPIREFVGLLRNAEFIVFSEGSAIHSIELCGRIRASVFVIGRRSGTEARFSELLSDLAARHITSFHLVAPMALPPRLDLMRSDYVRGCPFVDIRAILSDIEDFFEIRLDFDESRARAAVRLDLIDYLLDRRTLIRGTPPDVLGKHLLYLQDVASRLGV